MWLVSQNSVCSDHVQSRTMGQIRGLEAAIRWRSESNGVYKALGGLLIDWAYEISSMIYMFSAKGVLVLDLHTTNL